MTDLYYDTLHFSDTELYFAATKMGLVYVGTKAEKLQSAKRSPEKMNIYKEELAAYLHGNLRILLFQLICPLLLYKLKYFMH